MTTLPQLTQFKITKYYHKIEIIAFYRFSFRILITSLLRREPNSFSLAGIKAHRDNDGGRILLGDNAHYGGDHAAADQVPVVGSWASTRLYYIYIIYM